MDELLKKRVVGRCFCCLASNHLSLIVATMFGASTALSLGIVLATVDPPPPISHRLHLYSHKSPPTTSIHQPPETTSD
jgi:hypothetical protein